MRPRHLLAGGVTLAGLALGGGIAAAQSDTPDDTVPPAETTVPATPDTTVTPDDETVMPDGTEARPNRGEGCGDDEATATESGVVTG